MPAAANSQTFFSFVKPVFCRFETMLQTMRIFFILLVLVFLGCDSREIRLQRFLLQGNEALSEQNYEGADYYFQEALKLDPCFKDALNNLGVLNSNRKRFDVAIDYFNKAVSCDAGFLPAYFNRANSFYESKEYYRLLNDADIILKVKPDTAVVFVLRGLALSKLRKYDDALTAFSKAIELEPANPEHYINRGTVKYYQRKWIEAALDFKKSLGMQPSQANALNALGLIASDNYQFDSARYYFNEALLISPNQPYFLNNLGYVYLQQMQFEKAVELINRSITLDPDNAWAYRNKGIYYLLKEDYANSVRLLKQALAMDESVDKIHLYYGLALLKSGDTANGCLQLKSAKENNEGKISDEIIKRCR